MRIKIIIILILVFQQHIYSQNDTDFIFEISFNTNIMVGSINPDHDYSIVKLKSSCKYEGIEYQFLPKDSVLLRYFSELKSLFIHDNFDSVFNKTCNPDNFTNKYPFICVDGIITNCRFNSDSVERKFSIEDGTCQANSIYDQILDKFFNIAFYIINNSNPKQTMPMSEFMTLDYIEGVTGNSPIRLVAYKPMTYRLKKFVSNFDNEYEFSINLFRSLPIDQTVIIDVGNYFKISHYDFFYYPFKEYIKMPNKIIWIAHNRKMYKTLRSIGVKRNRIRLETE